MTGLVLHDDELDENGYKVRLLLGALRLSCIRIPVDRVPRAAQTGPALLLDPPGTLPVLVDGEGTPDPIILRDAEAILCHLATRYDPARRWLPADPAGFAAVMTWLVFAARDLNAAVLARRRALFDDDGDGPRFEAAARRSFRVMEDHMTLRRYAGAAFFVGSGPTLADLALLPSFALSRDFGVDHEAYPALRRWFRRVRAIDGFTTMPGIPDYH